MEKVNVKILNQTTLVLEEDAKKGDIIDLNEVNKLDTSIILERIKEGTDKLYQIKLDELKENFEISKKNAINEAKDLLEKENIKLKNDIEKIKKETESALNLKFTNEKALLEKEVLKLSSEMNTIKKETESALNLKFAVEKSDLQRENQGLKNDLESIEFRKDAFYKEQLTRLEKEKEALLKQIEMQKITFDLEKKVEFTELNSEYDKQLQEKEDKINQLIRDRSLLNVKKIGENLEKWCDQEYQNQSLALMDFISWEKDNEIIKGGKADFVYRVYADNNKKTDEILTSAVLEMKSEDPNSVNHQLNSKFYKKLNDDRNNKGLEYAILVSELEMDTANDAPIKRITEYDKMYLVRPQYFIIFLNIITTFGIKYKEIFLDKKEEALKFKDSQTILDEFSVMKNEILDNSIKHIMKNLETIVNQSDAISKANAKLLEAANTILSRHITTIENKLLNFKINKIISQIDKLDS